MKKIIFLFLMVGTLMGGVSTSTFTQITANQVYYISTAFGAGVRGEHVALYVEYINGDETSVDLTIEWLPNFTWAGTTYYAIGERGGDETMQPVTLKFDTTDNTMYRVKVPAAASLMYITTTYVGGSTGTFKINAIVEKD